MLNFEQVKKILPQRFPFIMIDRVLEIKKNKITAIKNVTGNEIFFLGHFPEKSIMPGAMIIEGIAQTSIIITSIKAKQKKKVIFYFGSVKARFYHPVLPGDTIRYEVDIIKMTQKGSFIEGKAYVGEKLVAEAELVNSVK